MKTMFRLLLVLALLIVWDVAFVQWRRDGLEDLNRSERMAAEKLLFDVRAICLDNPFQQILTRHLHVAAVHGPVSCGEAALERRNYFLTGWVGRPPDLTRSWFGAPLPPAHDVTIDVYTVFGLPLQTVSQKACSTTISCM